MIEFKEHSQWGYRPRTIENASADATIAFAVDFSTAGEFLTERAVLQQGKLYIPINLADLYNFDNIRKNATFIVSRLNKVKAKTINIAGNSIASINLPTNGLQEGIDELVYKVLKEVIEDINLENKIELIRSGGQTGVDEAGAKAGDKLEIPTLVLAPRGWMFRNKDGKDIKDEKQFKARFQIT